VVYGSDQTFAIEARGATATTEAITAPPAQPIPPSPPVPGNTSLPLVLAQARQSTTRWREGSRVARISRAKTPTGTTFSFSLNEQAAVTFAFTRYVVGLKVGGGYVTQTEGNRRRPPCRRTAVAGTLTFTGHSGANKVAFQGRISPAEKLAPGRYTLVIAATSAAGARSAPQSLSFTIVK
jgi:hypothetical protein